MTALHQQLSDSILQKIQAGQLQVGEKLPPEADYAVELGVSRSTLRLAYTELERVGVLQRKKRAGTTIISDRPQSRFNMSTTGLHELLSLGRDTELRLTGTRTVPTDTIAHLQGYESETDQWLEISGTRTLPGETVPFNNTQIYVPARYAAIEHILEQSGPSVFRTIEERFGITVGRVSQTAKAIKCPAEIAGIIGVDVDAPALRIVAQLYDKNAILMEISVATFDPERFQLQTDVEID
ncbi:GntR family transcriptional regulator [Marinovum sp. 2_MG-2023]|uniref:GntR family transcriptional regulator n=1 Tax=Roseobacteraceae TaxID=2854170 RepID=UPI001FCF8F24|nr:MULTISPECIES: GntR family transcriptional regulator [Roseobacteraceae]MCJ7873509.1 GntR family transcriptional regulator [Phaeobacter sp. J2-8]MDO6729041.1 GntR family transcriptional regulator [Marinovum sp. 2_MG-2023]MDO6779332.1 GntR family transcriptional regulator [Marinovum sp. 1_MG-2023]